MYIHSRTGFEPRLRNRARGLAGAEAGGAMQAVAAGQSAQGLAGAECRGSLISYAKGYAGAEARGAPAIKALGFAGAEAGGTLEPASPAYANGFKNYLEFLLPQASIETTGILNCLLSIDETFPELRTVANGGLVEHASGFDQQLELADGTVLPFSRLLWDATTGRIVARARFALLPQADTRFRLFFGKTVSVDGANEGGAYAAHLAAPNIRTGADRTGLSRTWTPTSITAGTLAGYAATFNGTSSQLVRTNPAELNGLGAITVQALVQLAGTAADKPIFIAGPSTGSDFGLHLRFRVSDGRLVFTIQVGTANTTVESQDDVMPAIGTPMLVAATWASGQAPKLFIDGEPLTLAVAGTALTGTTNATLGAAASEALIGFNRAVGNRWNGQIADLMVSARALTGGHLQTQALNYLTPRQCYGVGAANSANQTNLSPVLPPIQATATVGADAEVDPALIAYEPDAGQTKTLTSHDGVAGGGTFTMVGGRARFRPTSAGRWLSTAAVVDNGTPPKRSLAPIIWMASAAATGTPRNPPEPMTVAKIRTVGYSRGDGSTQYNAIDAGLNAAQPGDHVYLDDKDWGTEPIRVTTNGTAGNHVVIRSRSHKGAVLRMNIRAVGNYLWWHGLTPAIKPWDPTTYTGSKTNDTYDYAEAYSLALFGHHQIVTRCNIRASNGIWINESTKSNFAEKGTKTNDIAVAYCTFPNDLGGSYGPHCNIYMGSFASGSKGPLNVEIAYNLSNDPGANPNGKPGSGYWLYTGNSQPKDTPSGNNATFELHHNNINTNKTSCAYIKRGGHVRYNRFNNTGNDEGQTLNIRHSGRSKEDGTFLPAADICYIEGNLFAQGHMSISDTDWIIRFNEMASSNSSRDIELMCGQARPDGSGDLQAAHRTVLVGNKNVRKYIIGSLSPSPFLLKADQGGKVKDVKIYKAGETISTSHITVDQMEAGGYQILDGQPAGTPSITPITLAALQAVCGCDIP